MAYLYRTYDSVDNKSLLHNLVFNNGSSKTMIFADMRVSSGRKYPHPKFPIKNLLGQKPRLRPDILWSSGFVYNKTYLKWRDV